MRTATRQQQFSNKRMMRAHFDGSYDEATDIMTFAACVYNAGGQIIARKIGKEEGGSCQLAEAKAALLAASTVALLTINDRQPWQLMGDNRQIIALLDSNRRIANNVLRSVIRQCRPLLGDASLVVIKRDRNWAAHYSADQKDAVEEGEVVDLPLISEDPKVARHEQQLEEAYREFGAAMAKQRCVIIERKPHRPTYSRN